MTFGWPLRIVAVIGVFFLVQSVWSISSVRVTPLPVNHDMPKFSDIPKEAPAQLQSYEMYRASLRAGFERLKDDCNADTLREFAHSVTFFYINAVGNQHRAGVDRIEDAPGWSKEDQKVDNFVAAMAKAHVLKPEHFPANLARAEGRVPLTVERDPPHLYPDWAEPPRTLGCPSA